ncbi:unnamed protein product, partial [Meganyctiphanes norvegica]
MYVRGPTKEDDISNFVASVTFILDQSYAPHHVITIKKSPFVLSRRGWGEFKVQIVLQFLDKRNKSVRLLHPLVLSRADDQLALTGLWRLGQENWYDVWVYEVSPDGDDFESCSTSNLIKLEDDNVKPSNLQNELKIGSVISKIDDNVTIVHNIEKELNIKVEPSDYNIKRTLKYLQNSETEPCDSIKSESSIVIPKLMSNSASDKTCENKVTQSMSLTANVSNSPNNRSNDIDVINKLDEEKNVESISKVQSSGVGGKVCKIHVRQPDGRLLPCYIPAHMYSLALKIAQGSGKAASIIKDNKVEQ